MNFIEILKYLPDLSPIVLSMGLFFGIKRYKYLDKLHKCIFFYLSVMLVLEILIRVLQLINNNNLVILPVYSLIELILLSYFYNKYLFSKPNKLLIALSIAGCSFIIAEIFQYFIFNTLDVKQFQPYAKVADNFIVILFALLFFYQKMRDFKETRWDNFRLNIAILVFFTFNTIIFLPLNFMINESSGVKYYFWTGNVVMLILFYIYLTSLIWKNGMVNKKTT